MIPLLATIGHYWPPWTLISPLSHEFTLNWLLSMSFCRKKIEEIGKMTALSQEEIISNTKTVVQGLETLKNEHHQILNSLLSSMKTIKKENGDTNLVEEKSSILKKSLDMIDLGLGESQVSSPAPAIYHLGILLGIMWDILLVSNLSGFSIIDVCIGVPNALDVSYMSIIYCV